jgi:hypothetical protein
MRRKSDWTGELLNPEDIPSWLLPRMPDVLARVRSAGAQGPLEYVGVGMFGVVLCDRENVAWKVFHREKPASSFFLLHLLEEEYDFLKDAAQTEAAPYVARVYAMYPEELVLTRECVRGRPGGWADAAKLWEVHRKIEEIMMPSVGWTAPEFKEDSYIFRPNGTPVLVDASMPHRVGLNLARYVEDVIEGRKVPYESWRTLAFYILREIPYGTIPEEVYLPLLRRLVELDPTIKEGFIMPPGF